MLVLSSVVPTGPLEYARVDNPDEAAAAQVPPEGTAGVGACFAACLFL